MRPLAAWLATLALLGASACGGDSAGGRASAEAEVEWVVDGDTLRLASGDKVRLLQVDAPELSEGECYAKQALRELIGLAPKGTVVRLEADRSLDDTDRFGRLLRYAYVGDLDVNVELARRGAAAPYFYEGSQGTQADELLAAAHEARSAGRGLWRACPGTPFRPDRQVDARR